MEQPNVPETLRLALAAGLECPLEIEESSYFLSTIDLRLGDAPGMPRWRKRLFVATSHITADAAEYFGLPRDRTVITGSQIEVECEDVPVLAQPGSVPGHSSAWACETVHERSGGPSLPKSRSASAVPALFKVCQEGMRTDPKISSSLRGVP